ncbi:MAG: hydrogenase expression/synthesis HypA [Acidobacteriaceae bacterium]|nr:hydrogenase expression/synthesis HypA [Acidobacteriaceae bacterium]
MHELSIAVSMVEHILEESESRGGLRIEAVHLRLGALAGVDEGALLFSYEIACEGTPLAGSRLLIEPVPLLMYCETCDMERTPPSVYELVCPHCHSPGQTLLQGRELEVMSLELAA